MDRAGEKTHDTQPSARSVHLSVCRRCMISKPLPFQHRRLWLRQGETYLDNTEGNVIGRSDLSYVSLLDHLTIQSFLSVLIQSIKNTLY